MSERSDAFLDYAFGFFLLGATGIGFAIAFVLLILMLAHAG